MTHFPTAKPYECDPFGRKIKSLIKQSSGNRCALNLVGTSLDETQARRLDYRQSCRKQSLRHYPTGQSREFPEGLEALDARARLPRHQPQHCAAGNLY